MRFVPLQDFFSEETKSQYCNGMFYSVRPSNTKLAALVEKWLAEGKVRKATDVAVVKGSDRKKSLWERIRAWL